MVAAADRASPAAPAAPEPVLVLAGVRKIWPNGTAALRGVDLSVVPGKVHGLLGANGAGKSTLIKILAGAIPPSGGTIRWQGSDVRWSGPRAARKAGIATVYQHIPLVPDLSAAENMLLEERRGFRQSGRDRVAKVVRALGQPFDPDALVADLPIGQRQMVAIAQALMGDPALVIMDEPTASLAGDERARVYQSIRRLAAAGRAVLFVSHFLDEIMALTDEVTVLRDGVVVRNAPTAGLDEAAIAEAIVGRAVGALERRAPKPRAAPQETPRQAPVLEVRDLASPGRLAPASLAVRAGEILGIAGMLGAGRSELLQAIFRADPAASGDVRIDGQPIPHGTDAAVAAGMALVPEDRARQGFIAGMSIADNIALPKRGLLIHARAERAAARAAIARLAIRAPGPDALVGELSGGNAQKVVLAKWLAPTTRVLLLDEPTAGIDIGARTDILQQMRALADGGMAIILVSSEFEELLAVADRLLVMRDGAIVASPDPLAIDEAGLVRLASSASNAGDNGGGHAGGGRKEGTRA